MGNTRASVSATVKYNRITVLGAFDIKYMPRTSVMGQVLTNLVAEFTESPRKEVAIAHSMDEESVGTISLKEPLLWKIYVDGVANQRGSVMGLVLEGIY